MAEAVVEAILGHLECAICHCRLENPKCLKCLHTFCESCINRAVEANAVLDEYDRFGRPNHRITCPMCRQETGYDYDRSEALRPNLLANNIIEEIKRHEDSESKKKFCKEHGAGKKFFCEKCNVLICSECALCNHGKHTFLVKNLEEASKAKVEEIVKLMSRATEWMESFENFRGDYAVKQAEGNERLDNISEAIKVRFDSYLEHVTDIINHRKEDLLAEVKTNRSDLNEALDNILIPVGEAVSKVTEEIKFAEELLDSTEPKEVVLRYEDLAKRLRQGTDQQIPNDVAARRQCTKVGCLHFSENEAPVFEAPNLGVLWLQVPEANNQGEEIEVPQDQISHEQTSRSQCPTMSSRKKCFLFYAMDALQFCIILAMLGLYVCNCLLSNSKQSTSMPSTAFVRESFTKAREPYYDNTLSSFQVEILRGGLNNPNPDPNIEYHGKIHKQSTKTGGTELLSLNREAQRLPRYLLNTNKSFGNCSPPPNSTWN